MQGLAGVDPAEFLAAGQEPLLKLKIWVDPDWVNLCDLDGEKYVQDISVSLGGAGMTPHPVEGTWSATIFNREGVFHPEHPTSAYKDYLKTGRKVKASIGAKYGEEDEYWQRIIGYIDEPRFEEGYQRISISGADYMKLLADTQFQELDATHPNYWGALETFSTGNPEGTLGAEIYVEEDAMDEDDAGHDTVAPWNVRVQCTFESIAATSGQSNFEGRAITTDVEARIENPDVGNATVGEEYKVTFWYKKFAGSALPMSVGIYQDIGGFDIKCGGKSFLNSTSWTSETFYFTALKTGILIMKAYFQDTGQEFRIDHISIKKYGDPQYYKYELPVGATGVHYATLDEGDGAEPVWPGKQKGEGWYYDSEDRYFYFDEDKRVEQGTDNLVVYYYTATHPEDAVARILWFAGLYASEVAAKAAMDLDDPGFTIDKVFFKAGTTLLSAIKLICERCDYRFYFKWDGTPVFKAKASYSDLLTDGGMELWDDDTHLTEWSETVLGTSTINKEATEKIEGAFSCRIDVDAGNSLSYFYQSFSMTVLKRYKIIIWYKNSAVGKTARFRIKDSGNNVYLKADGTWQAGEIYITLPNSIIWTPYELEFNAHAAYTDYQILLRVLSAASSSIYFDKVSIWREEFTFTDQKHIASFSNYQDSGEIKNRIIIKGLKQALPEGADETTPSELVGEAADDGEGASIDTYGERTLTITNHLFQTQGPLDAMCVSMLAEYKDPKWYKDLVVPYNPVPIELGDMIGWKERLSPTLELIQRGMVRDIKIEQYTITYKCEKH